MKIIASKLPPHRAESTYFSSGRAAFAFLVGEIARPRRVFLPTFTCWSLVSTMQRRFAHLELEFYPVRRDLTCEYPAKLRADDLLVFIHFFGHGNLSALPSGGVLVEDVSHSYFSRIPRRGDYVFGSLRKVMRVGDGGFVEGFYNPVYEPSRKLDTWLRYEAQDWRDVREAENMLDRDWVMSDMSSQSLAVFLTSSADEIRLRRAKNERFLFDNLRAGRPLLEFRSEECPLLHQRVFESSEERNALRSFLASSGIFTSIHWPTHPLVRAKAAGIADTLWLEEHSLAFPVGSDYDLDDMRRIVDASQEWADRR